MNVNGKKGGRDERREKEEGMEAIEEERPLRGREGW